MLKHYCTVLLTLAGGMWITGCTVHPPGEAQERAAALASGKPYERPVERRPLSPLPDHPSAGDLVKYALLNSPDLEQHYWQWRAAIEQITRDGTQPANLAITGGTALSHGSFSLSRTTLAVSNDPMADIVWPTKLSTAARRALQDAMAAGIRFQKAKRELKARVLDACAEMILASELLELEKQNAQLLKTALATIEARVRTGSAGQQERMKAAIDADLSANQIAELESQLPQQRAMLNALLGRSPDAQLSISMSLPETRPAPVDDAAILSAAVEYNPELTALLHESLAREQDVALAKLGYIPDFSLGASTDLMGIAQTLSGMVTVPIFRHEAIEAAIAQAEANLRGLQAARRQAANDVQAAALSDLLAVRATDRQLNLLNQSILPMSRESTSLARTEYETGRGGLLDLLSSQRESLDLQRLAARLRATRCKRLADLEAIAGPT